MLKKTLIVTGISGAVAVAFLSSQTSSALADSIKGAHANGNRGVIGVVSSISGTNIIIATKTARENATTTFAVDAANATITKSGATIPVSSIQTGDKVIVQGTVSGESVTATKIIDGLPGFTSGTKPGMHVGPRGERGNGTASSSPKMPVFAKGQFSFGGVTAVNGSSFTIQLKNPLKTHNASSSVPATLTYTVNTTAMTTFKKDGKEAALTDIAAGESVLINGSKDSNSGVINATNVSVITHMPNLFKRGHATSTPAAI